MNYFDFIPVFVDVKPCQTHACSALKAAKWHRVPSVDRIHYNGTKSIFWFSDGTKVIVDCSAEDKYDRKTALAYAICKRMFGKVMPDGTVDGNGFGQKMQKIVDAGFDQVRAEKEILEKKRKAKAEHLARQKHDQEAAFERKVKARAEELRIERAANDLLNDPDNLAKTKKQMLNESEDMTVEDFFEKKPIKVKEPIRTSGLLQVDPKDAWKLYCRPNKPFSQFTQQEKRDYWRYHNAKRRGGLK